MERKAMKSLIQWKSSREAILVTGARQVGKTFLIREFLMREYGEENYVEFNLYENSLARQTLENVSSKEDLIFRLSALSNKPLVKGKSVIFLDEIQVCKNIITAIKFLVDDGNYKYILSGSLLGVELNDIESMPVGYLKILNMYPMDFEEFLIANGINQSVLEKVKNCFLKRLPVDEIVHKKLLEMFNLYIIVGGMPAVVNKYLETNNLKDVVNEQEMINKLYKLDIGKYDKNDKLLINEIYELIPSELNNQNKRFILKNLNENLKFNKYENSFLWLKDAGVALPTYLSDEPRIPLKLSKSRNLFKLFHSDVGLLSSMYMDNGLQLKILNREKDINFGSVFENAVAEELTSKGYDLYYYKNNKLGEIDFLIEYNLEVLPIEVKSGKNYKKHSALDNVLKIYTEIKEAFIFCNSNVEKDDKKTYLPIYMVMFMDKKRMEDMVYKVNLSSLK